MTTRSSIVRSLGGAMRRGVPVCSGKLPWDADPAFDQSDLILGYSSVTSTRASTATSIHPYVDSILWSRSYATDEARVLPNGWVIVEGSVLNLNQESEDFSTGWTTDGLTRTDSITDPFGGATASSFVADAVANDRFFLQDHTANWNGVRSIWGRLSSGDDDFGLREDGNTDVNGHDATTVWAIYRAFPTADQFFIVGFNKTSTTTGIAPAASTKEFAFAMSENDMAYVGTYIPSAGANVTRAADDIALPSASVTTDILTGDWRVQVIPWHSDSDLGAGENHYIYHNATDDYLKIYESAGTVFCEMAAGGVSKASTAVTYTGGNTLTIDIDRTGGNMILSGFDTGDGSTALGASNDWTSGDLQVGSTTVPASHFDGAISYFKDIQ